MSYILEALRKSDAERERSAVPDLHSQPLELARGDADATPRRGRLWLWPVVGAAVVLAATLTWRFTAHDAPPVLAAAPAPLPVPASPPPPSPPPAPSPSPSLVPSTPAVTAPTAPAAGPTATVTVTVTAAAPATPASTPVLKVRAKPQPTSPAADAATKKASAPQPAVRVPLLAELPEDLRRQVPAMAIGGSVYSPQRASRMLVVNGQVFREGSPVAPQLQLEQIGPKAAVFSIRGQRFEVPL